jgi:hypothetical protein
MNSRRTIALAMTAIPIAATLALVGTRPVQADDSGNIFHGNDMAYWNHGHYLLHTCDYELDGHKVRVHLKNGYGQVFYGSWAPSQGCVPNSINYSYVLIRLCEEEAGCTEWNWM